MMCRKDGWMMRGRSLCRLMLSYPLKFSLMNARGPPCFLPDLVSLVCAGSQGESETRSFIVC